MKYEDISIGDVVPLEGFRKPFGGRCDAIWFILTTGRQRREMLAASAWLMANGATECWFPEEVCRKNIRKGGKVFRERYERAIVPGVVFMLTGYRPEWDILADRKRIRPLRVGETPVAITPEVLAEMELVPGRIAEMKAAIEAQAQAEREASIPRPGDEVVFRAGPFIGRPVRIDAVTGDEAVMLIDGIRVKAPLGTLEKKS